MIDIDNNYDNDNYNNNINNNNDMNDNNDDWKTRTIITKIIVTIVTTLTNDDYIQYRVILARWAVLLSEAR